MRFEGSLRSGSITPTQLIINDQIRYLHGSLDKELEVDCAYLECAKFTAKLGCIIFIEPRVESTDSFKTAFFKISPAPSVTAMLDTD